MTATTETGAPTGGEKISQRVPNKKGTDRAQAERRLA